MNLKVTVAGILGAVVLAALVSTPGTLAQAPSPSPSSTPAGTGDAAADASAPTTDEPFSYPLLTSPSDVPLPSALQPKGRPDASTTRNGIRVDLWLSSPVAKPGKWVQAVVRTTNLLGTPAWFMPYPCLRSGTVVGIDARAGIPPGDEQEGNAAELKRRAVRKGPYLWAGFDQRKDVLRWVTSGASMGASWDFVECTHGSEPRRLGPRASVTERFAWYPASSFDEEEGVWFQPLWPGNATVAASWPYLGHGQEPTGDNQDLWRRTKRIETTAGIEIAGDGPGTLSIPELVDRALAHPRFRAWVDEDPTRESWYSVRWGSASGPTYPHNLFSIGLQDPPPYGLLWLELGRVRTEPDRSHMLRGVVTMDPWTGEVLRVHCVGSSSSSCPVPTILDEEPG